MRWALVVIIGFAIGWAVPDATVGVTEAEAQVWKPESKKRRKPPVRKKRRKPRKKAPAPAEPAEEAASDDDGDDDGVAEEVIEEGAPAEEAPPDDGPAFEEEPDEEVLDDSAAEDAIVVEDDLAPVGADVTFDAADLATGRAAEGAAGKNVTRLETLAMSFLRMGVDAVHDPVPTAPTGVKAIGEDTLSFRAHARAEGVGRFGKRVKVKVAGRVNADLSLDADTNVGVERYEAEVWDTYADAYWSWIDVRFGRQMVAWGSADLLSPNDVVNPRDLRRGFLDRPDELRLPVLALAAKAYDGPFSLQALWVPVAPTNRFELLEGDYALLGPNGPTLIERRVGAIVSTLLDDPQFGPQLRPFVDISAQQDRGLESGELGAKVAMQFDRFDMAGYAFWGHERNARIELHPDLRDALLMTAPDDYTPQGVAMAISGVQMMGANPVDVSYPRKLHFGASMAGRIEPVGLKLDVGYDWNAVATLVPPGGGPLIAQPASLPQLGATVSVDYDRGQTFTFVLEASHLRVFDVPDDRDVFQYDHDQLNLVASRLEWTPARGPITLRFLGIVDPIGSSYALRPAIRLSGHDNLSLEIAGTVFGGPVGSYGGVATRNDEVMLTAQYGL